MEAARQRDRVHIVAPPARDAQHLVDARARARVWPEPLIAGQPLLRDGRDQRVVVERRGGESCMPAWNAKMRNEHPISGEKDQADNIENATRPEYFRDPE